jgi:hypothetical protein
VFADPPPPQPTAPNTRNAHADTVNQVSRVIEVLRAGELTWE